MHSIYDPDQGRLQMRQKPLDKFLVLFEQACLHWVKGIDHLIDQILQLPVFNRQGFPGIPPYPLMLGTLDMQADVGNLHRRKADSEFLFQLRRDLLIQANNALQKLDGNLGTIYDYPMENPELFAEALKDDEENREERKKRIRKGKRRVSSATQAITALINQEAEKIKGLKDSDRRRYKDLPD